MFVGIEQDYTLTNWRLNNSLPYTETSKCIKSLTTSITFDLWDAFIIVL